MDIKNYTLCYSHEDGKFYKGLNCTEIEECFAGEITKEVVDVAGYSGNGAVLTLDGFDFSTTADIAVAVPDGTTIVFRGKNFIRVENDRKDANVAALQISGDVVLQGGEEDTLEVVAVTDTELWSRAICARGGNVTVHGGNIIALGGKARKNCGIYAGGHIWIDVGEKAIIEINGGHITSTKVVSSKPDGLHIKAGAKVVNAKEYTGGNTAWIGKGVNPIDAGEPVVISF